MPQGLKVLLLDDGDRETISFLKGLLSSRFQVELVPLGLDAEEIAERARPWEIGLVVLGHRWLTDIQYHGQGTRILLACSRAYAQVVIYLENPPARYGEHLLDLLKESGAEAVYGPDILEQVESCVPAGCKGGTIW
ncbi:MAG: hypothetical protein AAB881_00280 [Patescibacteria group bacterium]